jgi:hypothetical protein
MELKESIFVINDNYGNLKTLMIFKITMLDGIVVNEINFHKPIGIYFIRRDRISFLIDV